MNGTYTVDHSDSLYDLAFGHYILGVNTAIMEGEYKNNIIKIDGAIAASAPAGVGIHSYGYNTTIQVGAGGSIDASTAIMASGDKVYISNNGTINGNIFMVETDDGTFSSDGKLNGGLSVTNAQRGSLELGQNSQIKSTDNAITVSSNVDNTTHITNLGHATGKQYALYSSAGVEDVVNKGTMTGAISLGAGDDTFDNLGGKIDHPINGGAGNDTYILDRPDAIMELAKGGLDTVKSAISMSLSSTALAGQEIENLVLLGAKAINATGNALDNVITGNVAANRLTGGAGLDTMKGGDGNDSYYADRVTDKVIETNSSAAVGGVDTVHYTGASGTFVLGANVEKLVLDGASDVKGTGNSLGNALTGNSGNNTLSGQGGNDRIAGGSGKDVLTGGAGHDTFVFKTGYGKDTVTDFENGKDHFDLKSWAAIDDFADLKAHHLTVSGNNIIVHAGSDSLTIKDVTMGELSSGDFMF
jgi:hypothetical protein